MTQIKRNAIVRTQVVRKSVTLGPSQPNPLVQILKLQNFKSNCLEIATRNTVNNSSSTFLSSDSMKADGIIPVQTRWSRSGGISLVSINKVGPPPPLSSLWPRKHKWMATPVEQVSVATDEPSLRITHITSITPSNLLYRVFLCLPPECFGEANEENTCVYLILFNLFLR